MLNETPFPGFLMTERRCFFMQEIKQYPWAGCGTDKEITGCRFSLAIMADDYADKILAALKKTDTTHVHSQTDILSTTYRGHMTNVINAVRDLFVNVNDEQTHITLEATLSKGCPGDTEEDIPMALIARDAGNKSESFPVHCKFSFYPMGEGNYMDHIAHIILRAQALGIYDRPSHYATQLVGDVNTLFDYFHEIMSYADAHLNHFIYQITLSVNSPSLK